MTAEFGATTRANCQDAITPLFCPTDQTRISYIQNFENTNDFRFILLCMGLFSHFLF